MKRRADPAIKVPVGGTLGIPLTRCSGIPGMHLKGRGLQWLVAGGWISTPLGAGPPCMNAPLTTRVTH